MFDEYAKQLDLILDKDEYDRTNFEEKISKREALSKQANDILSSNYNNMTKKSNIKNKNKRLKSDQKDIITNNDLNKKIQGNFTKNLKLQNEREIIKKKYDILSKQLNELDNKLLQISKEKEDLAKYLFQIEKAVRNSNSIPSNTTVMSFSYDKEKGEINFDNSIEDNGKYNLFNSQSLIMSISGSPPNIIIEDNNEIKNVILSKNDLMKYLDSLYKENQGLKNFQNQVCQLSKAYDDTNNNLAECIAGFEELCIPNSKINEKEIDTKLNELKKQILNALETKQNEYNILLDKKDEDLDLLKGEFVESEKEIKKNERSVEQRKIMELYKRIEELNNQIEKIEKENKSKKNNN